MQSLLNLKKWKNPMPNLNKLNHLKSNYHKTRNNQRYLAELIVIKIFCKIQFLFFFKRKIKEKNKNDIYVYGLISIKILKIIC